MAHGIYIASKAHRYQQWRQLRLAGWPIISTWIDDGGVGKTLDFADLYTRCIREASSCSVLICHSEPGEVLKGALVEVGAALAGGVPVLWCGPRQNCCAHPLVREVASLSEALSVAEMLVMANREKEENNV